jgi:hypothetical protein
MAQEIKYLTVPEQIATTKRIQVGSSAFANMATSLILITIDGFMQEKKGADMLIQNLKFSTEETLHLRSMIGLSNARPAGQNVR